MIHLSDHAVERFRERVCPDYSLDEARDLLRQLADGPQAVINRTPLPQPWRSRVEGWSQLCCGVVLVLQRVRNGWLGTTVMVAPGMRIRIGR